MKFSLILCALVIFYPGFVQAEPRLKRSKKFSVPGVRVKVPRKKRALPLRDIQPPPVSVYYAPGSDEAELEKIQNQEIAHLFKLIKKKRTGDLILRLGSLYVDKARFINFKLQSDYQKKFEDFEKGRRKTRPTLNLRASVTYNKRALKLFREYKNRYPKSKRIDEVLFFLGFNSYQINQDQQGFAYFKELERRFPKSLYLYEAFFQLGEHYFKKSELKKALQYYKKVSKEKSGKFYFLSLFKLGWSYYKLGQANKALIYLEDIIRKSRNLQPSRDPRVTFRDEAVSDLVLFYTYSSKDPRKARAYFYRLLPEAEAFKALKKLAYSYQSTGHNRGLVSVFTHLIDEDPLALEAFSYQHQIVRSLYSSGSSKSLFKHIKYWISNYSKKSAWARKHRRNRAVLEKSYQTMESTLRSYALKNHQIFRKSKSQKTKNKTLAFYKLYFSEFAKSSKADQMNFFYGEILFDSKRYAGAVRKYEHVISQYPKSKYVTPSYTNQILALEKLLPKAKDMPQSKTLKQARTLPLSVENFIKSGFRYIKIRPKAQNTPSILYKIASLYYNYHHLDKAATTFKNLYNTHPSFKEISRVGSLLLDIYNQNKDYKSLQDLARQFVKNKKVSPSLLQEAQSILSQLSLKKAEDLVRKKDYKGSAELYASFAKNNPRSKFAASSLYNSGINYEKISKIKQASSMYESLLAYRKADPKLRKKAREFLPVLYEKLGYYAKAARGYALYAQKFKQEKKASSYWYNAGIIYDAFNNIGKATQAYKQYLKTHKHKDKYQALYLQASLYERNFKWKQAVALYKAYIKSPGSTKLSLVEASFKLAEIYRHRLKQQAKAAYWYNQTIAYYKKFRVGVSYAAQAHFYKTLKIYTSFNSIRLGSSKNQKQLVDKKLALLKQLEKELASLIKYNDSEQIISALVLLGLANHKMAEAIYRTPLPKGLDAKGRQAYRKGIKNLIEPYLKEAKKSYTLSIKKSQKFQVYNEWIRQAFNGLRIISYDKGKFSSFKPTPLRMETSSFNVLDDMGLASGTFFEKFQTGKYKVSLQEKKRAYRALKYKKEAELLEVCSGLLSENPDNVFAVHVLSLFYIKTGRLKLASLIINRMLSKNKKLAPSLLNNLGVIALRRGERREAVAYFKKSLDQKSSHALAQANLGQLLVSTGNFSPAQIYLEKAWDNLEDFSAANHVFGISNNYGVALAGVQDFKESLQVYKRVEKKFPDRKQSRINKAIVLTEGLADKRSLKQAQSMVNELARTDKSPSFKRKLAKISRRIRLELKGK